MNNEFFLITELPIWNHQECFMIELQNYDTHSILPPEIVIAYCLRERNDYLNPAQKKAFIRVQRILNSLKQSILP